MNDRKPRVLFVHQKLEPYVLKDLAILQDAYEVREFEFLGILRTTPKRLLGDMISLMAAVWWSDITFSWFAKLHAFFAVLFSKILGKKAIVVSGGEEVARHLVGGKPYGLCTHPVKRWFASSTLNWADRVLSVSNYNLKETLENASANASNTLMIYHGFDSEVFRKVPGTVKENIVVTIGNVDEENLYRKGLKLFVESARLLPDTRFYLIGRKFGKEDDVGMQLLESIAPANLTLTGRLSKEDLISLLSRATVYVQASEHEAFGCSLAEAMLCECVPVVSRSTALPEVVGDCGFYVDEQVPEELAARICEAVNHPELGVLARRRIVQHFPLEKRRKEILKVVDGIGKRWASEYA